MPRLGPMELVVILVVVLMIFGVGKLPEVGKTLGKGIRDFRNAARGDLDEESDKDDSPNRINSF